MVAPSTSMDGMAGAIRTVFDDAGHDEISIMPYAVKYENTFHGPFRDATDGAPALGGRWHYQMGPTNAREALCKIALGVEQGADVPTVEPGLPYLDIVHAIREGYDHPVAVCNVSDEYAMFHAAAEKDWSDLDGAAHESLLSMKWAGMDPTITYLAECVARQFD